MKELVRDTVVGKLLRLVSRGKILPFEEERDPSFVDQYIDKEKSRRMAHHGTVDEEEKDGGDEQARDSDGGSSEQTPQGSNERRRSGNNARVSNQQQPLFEQPRRSSDTRVGDNDTQRNAHGHPIDPEKGRDASIVTWYSDKDPEVSHHSLEVNTN